MPESGGFPVPGFAVRYQHFSLKKRAKDAGGKKTVSLQGVMTAKRMVLKGKCRHVARRRACDSLRSGNICVFLMDEYRGFSALPPPCFSGYTK